MDIQKNQKNHITTGPFKDESIKFKKLCNYKKETRRMAISDTQRFRCLFVTDRETNQQYLVETGSGMFTSEGEKNTIEREKQINYTRQRNHDSNIRHNK